MDLVTKEKFIHKWNKYFPGSDLPIACFYSDELNDAKFPKAPKPNKRGYTCLFSQLTPVRSGKPRAFTPLALTVLFRRLDQVVIRL